MNAFLEKSSVLKEPPGWSGGLGKAVWRRRDSCMVMRKDLMGIVEKGERRKRF